jgi:hypothetical protein
MKHAEGPGLRAKCSAGAAAWLVGRHWVVGWLARLVHCCWLHGCLLPPGMMMMMESTQANQPNLPATNHSHIISQAIDSFSSRQEILILRSS